MPLKQLDSVYSLLAVNRETRATVRTALPDTLRVNDDTMVVRFATQKDVVAVNIMWILRDLDSLGGQTEGSAARFGIPGFSEYIRHMALPDVYLDMEDRIEIGPENNKPGGYSFTFLVVFPALQTVKRAIVQPGADAVSTCGSDAADDSNFDLRVASIFIIMTASLLGALAPIVLARGQALAKRARADLVYKFIGAGVITATAWMHLLSPAVEALHECVRPILGEYDWVFAIGLTAVMVMFLLELLASHYEAKGVFIGLVLSTTDELVVLLVVLTFHRPFEGLALGSRVATIHWAENWWWVPYALAVAFGLSTPVAIAAGLGTRPSGRENQLITSGVFDSISGGILMYTGLVGSLGREFLYSPDMRRRSLKTQLFAFGCAALGSGVMVVLAVWA
ncbi:hypothetical protein RB599_010260 [Gaeumannomyces hyphopodioides]